MAAIFDITKCPDLPYVARVAAAALLADCNVPAPPEAIPESGVNLVVTPEIPTPTCPVADAAVGTVTTLVSTENATATVTLTRVASAECGLESCNFNFDFAFGIPQGPAGPAGAAGAAGAAGPQGPPGADGQDGQACSGTGYDYDVSVVTGPCEINNGNLELWGKTLTFIGGHLADVTDDVLICTIEGTECEPTTNVQSPRVTGTQG